MAVLQDLRVRLGRRVRELRHARGWTQEQLAERAVLSYKFIGEIERGTVNPTLSTLVSLADALDTAVSKLFAEAEQKSPPDYVTVSRRKLQMVREAARTLGQAIDETDFEPRLIRRRRSSGR